MPRKKSPHLTDAELRLMEVVWEKGHATVQDVVEALPKGTPLHYSTVLTTMRVLEKKGYLKHTQEGRAYVYRPVVARGQARERAVTHLVRKFFEGSPELLMLNLIETSRVRPGELKRLRKRIEEES
jgi:predicted transcriptional regulator